ncbi:MAG: murein hydrolase activator EnvC family protein [Methyloceanibacter sp.]|uniref:murein hydrolase activator EnvC family protein n=1 Tax=Methyloceanibacter sp. TaxID=1965321 RepID=UPI003D6D5D25
MPWQGHAEDDLSRDEAKKRLDETEQELQSSRVKAEGLTKDLVALAEERARLNSELIEAGERVQASEAKLSETEGKLAELTEQVNVIQSSITERKEAIVKMLSAMQRIGRTPPPALVTRRDDALAVVRSAMLLAEVFPELKYQADNLSGELDSLVTVENSIRAKRDEEKKESEQLAAERARLDQLLEEKKTKLAQGEIELTQLEQSTEALALEVTGLSELIERLNVQIAKVEVAQYDAEIAAEKALRERMQAQVMATPANESVVEIKPESTRVAFASPDRLKPALPFEQAKGTLRLPAQGRQLKGFGDADPAGSTLKGISLQTREEARITAPADGWVVYAGPFRSYGQLLIINAGGGYHILLAGMSRIDVSLGQFVLAGEPIAVMGNPAVPSSGDDSSRPVLYVEFRKDGRPVDPGPWWAAASGKVQG